MKRSNLLFKIFMPVTLGLTILALIFNALSLILTYSQDTGNIRLSSVFSILFIVFTSLSIILPIILSVLAKETSIIARTPSKSLFSIVASGIAITVLIALAIFDCVILTKELMMVSTSNTFFESLSQYFEFWRLARVVLTIPFIVHLVIGILPSKLRVPMPLKAFCHSMAILWCTITPVIVYFFKGTPPTTEYLRITYSILFIFLTFFFLYDFKWNYLETSFRVYSAITTIAASFTLIISLASLISIIARGDYLLITDAEKYQSIFDIHCISFFEILTALALGVLALSKVVSIFKTVNIVAKVQDKAPKK